MIPLVRPLQPDWNKVRRYYERSLKSGQLTNFGPNYIDAVAKLREKTGRWCLPCTNGTAAIRLAIQVHFGRGLRVAIPDFTHIGTLNAVISAGCEPVMIGCDSQTLGISKNELKKHRKEFDAFIVVSPFGYGVDLQGYDELSDEIGKPVIYDLAGAWGIKEHSVNPVSYSLHATKNLSVGEGGLTCFRDPDQMEKARKISNFSTMSDRSVADPFGDNLKLDELRCAVLLGLLDEHSHVVNRITKKIFATEIYNEQLSKFVIEHDFHAKGAPSLCVVFGIDAEKVEEKSHLYRCVMKRYFLPLSQMIGLKSVKKLSVSGPFFNTGLALPGDVTHEEIEQVVSAVKSALGG